MGAELATIVAVRRTSTDDPGLGTALPASAALTGRIARPHHDIELMAFATPTTALEAIDQLVDADPSLAVGVHVAELADDPALNQPLAELVDALARRAAAGDVLMTDVVAQLAGGSGRTFSSRGHMSVAGRPSRLHALAHQRSPSTGPTFGRGVELASLDWLVDELLAGSGRAVILEGEAGIGKSHLAAEALGRAGAVGILVARATADELGRDRPGSLAMGLVTELERRSPGRPGQRPPTGRGDHRFVEQFTAIIETFAQEQPVLLIAEDVHWADDLSLRAIGALATRLAPISAAMVLSFRPAPRPELLRKLRDVLGGAGAEHHLLDPLDPEAVTSLVATLTGAPPGPRLRDRLLTTAGNPLFVIEMLDALEHDRALDVAAGVVEVAADDIELPDRLREIALRRIRDLPETTVDVLRHACLLGSACQLEALSTITGRGAATVTEALLPAVEAGVLARSGDTVLFRHDVIREAVIADLAPAVRREMHTAAGTSLARAGASPVDVARQLALGAQPGDTEAVEWLERAADDVRVLDPSTTVDLLGEARALAPPGWAGVDRIECSMIEPLTASGQVDSAVTHAETVLSRSLEPALRKQATTALVSALSTRGDLLRAAEVAAEASADHDTDPHHRLVFDCVATSLRVLTDGSTDEVRRAARAALGVASGGRRSAADDELGCWAHHSLGWAALIDGRYEEALADFEESSRLLERLEITDHGFLIPHMNAGTAAAYLDDFEAFEGLRRVVMARCADRGEASLLAICHFGGALGAWATGRWDDALTEIEAALSLASETGADSMTVGLHAIAALIETGRGRPGEADHHLDRGFDVLARGAHLFGVDLLVLGRARRLEETGAADEAGHLLTGFWAQAGHIALALQYRDLLPHLMRLAGPMLGERQAEVLAAVDRAARNAPVPSTIATAARCHGLASGDGDLLIEAVEQLRQSPRRVELAEACEDAAAACFAAARHDEAAMLVDEAVAIWGDLAATNHIARLDAMARANGVRRRRSRPAGATHGWDALSPKELEVVELVADGLSNPVIGERLYISRRTVESHLSHVFTKLGLANRAQLAAAVVERRGARHDP